MQKIKPRCAAWVTSIHLFASGPNNVAAGVLEKAELMIDSRVNLHFSLGCLSTCWVSCVEVSFQTGAQIKVEMTKTDNTPLCWESWDKICLILGRRKKIWILDSVLMVPCGNKLQTLQINSVALRLKLTHLWSERIIFPAWLKFPS